MGNGGAGDTIKSLSGDRRDRRYTQSLAWGQEGQEIHSEFSMGTGGTEDSLRV